VNVLFRDDVDILGYMTSNGRFSGERRSVKDLEVTGRGFIEAPNERLSERAEQTPKPRQLMSERHVPTTFQEFPPLCKSYHSHELYN
jgi:hypothetical protein